MKKKSLLKKLICTSFAVTLLFSMSISVSATTTGNALKGQQQGVYTKSQVDAEWAKAKSKPLKADKVATKSSINGLVSAASVGNYPTRNGVILVTSDFYKGLIPTGHSAIIWTSSTVVESVSTGVTTGPNNWNVTKGTCYGVTTYGTTAEQDDAASNYCYSQIGKPYNWNYLNPYTRNSFYCSQLVYASFLDLYDIDLNTSAFLQAVHPMELVNSPNTYTIYQK